MTEVYYIEDDENIAQAVKDYLEQRGCRVKILERIADAQQALRDDIPAIVLVDWNMPDGRGDNLCQWIRRNWRELPIIFITARGDSCDIVTGFQSGADDYVVKPFDLEVLYSRILALLRRSGNVAEQYLSCDEIRIDQNRRVVSYCSEEINVSAAEYQLLLYMMQNKGKTVTREKILQQVWDVNGNYVNNNTLTVTMKRLRDKLHQPSCLKTVRSIGYRMEDTK
ncbi:MULTISPECIES: response regulator transcription factor [unclassified Clostridium]|mgnify:FL=1|uniref:response regulator transcription factor n=1 Tax=unclassified Clostridium TaxID=2614128 RepID=UPI001106BB0F|nr:MULTISPECIES: response regulator transcription factor [unclassified Clostridium]